MKEDYVVYVLDMQGEPLMPTKRFGKVRRMLRDKKTKVVQRKPFTIQLLYEPETHVVQEVVLGIDPGRTNIGVSCVREDGECLFSAEARTRNKDIPKLMQKRKIHRQQSRRGERLRRKRRAKAHKTLSAKNLKRVLPGCEEPLDVKDIINTEAKFNNRKRENGWLTPTATQLLRTHINMVKKIGRFLPVSRVSIEVNKFAFMELHNPYIKPWEYAKGPMRGFGSVKEALDAIQGRTCLLCGKPIDEKHHIVPRSEGGMDTLENLAGLCSACHEAVHKDADTASVLKGKKSGTAKKYAGASVLNQIMTRLLEELESLFPGHVVLTDGHATKETKEAHGTEKTHAVDAYCIGCAALEGQKVFSVPETVYFIKQYRRHDRSITNFQRPRVYKLDGKRIAANRRKGTEQKEGSLEDWYNSMVQEHGKEKADALRSSLSVTKSTKRRNNTGRTMPGAVFFRDRKRHVLKGQLTGGIYYTAEDAEDVRFPEKSCKIAQKNAGLVFV